MPPPGRAAVSSKLKETMSDFISLFGSLKEPEEPEKKQEDEQKSGFFSRMKQAVSRTRESFTSKIEDIVAMTRTVDESDLEELEAALITSDCCPTGRSAEGHIPRGRKRHRQDHNQRKARSMEPRAGALGSVMCGRYVSRRCD